ncbi:hypothetical protein GCM10029964_048500 [Kibdelosporangium lantanae]
MAEHLGSPAERAYDLVLADRADAAATLLTRAYEPSDVSGFFLAVCRRDFDEAADLIHDMGGDLEITDAGRIAVDLAARHLRDGDHEAAAGALRLVAATGFTSELWEYALDSGSLTDARAAAEVGTTLLQLALDDRDVDRAALIAERAEAGHPEVAIAGYRLLVASAEQDGDPAEAGKWEARLARLGEN